MLLNREHGIQKPFHLLQTMLILVLPDPLGVQRSRLHHATVCGLEIGVVLEEVAVPQHVRYHQFVLQQRIRLHQEGIAGIGVDHHLVDFAQPEVILHFLPIVGFPMRPVTEAPG